MTPKQRSLSLRSASQQMIVAAEEAAVCQWGTFWLPKFQCRSLLRGSEETRMILAAYLPDGVQTKFTKADRGEAGCGCGPRETSRVHPEI